MLRTIKAFAAGLLVGIFVAPRSGRASRQLLIDTLGRLFESGQRRYEELEDELAVRRSSNGPVEESEWPQVDESMIGEKEAGPGA